MKKKFIKNSFIALGFSIVSFSVYAAEPFFTVKNDTGKVSYTFISEKKTGGWRRYTDFRFRATFHEKAKEKEWLDKNQSQINKVDLPPQPEAILSHKIAYPSDPQEMYPSATKSITLYITASYIDDNGKKGKVLKGAEVMELERLTLVNHILIHFKGYTFKEDKNKFTPDIQLKINNQPETARTDDHYQEYESDEG